MNPAARCLRGAPSLSERRLLLLCRELGLGFLDVLLGLVVEGVATAGAANVESFVLVSDADGAQAATDDALGLAIPAGESGPFLRGADLIEPLEYLLAQRLHLVAVQIPIVMKE